MKGCVPIRGKFPETGRKNLNFVVRSFEKQGMDEVKCCGFSPSYDALPIPGQYERDLFRFVCIGLGPAEKSISPTVNLNSQVFQNSEKKHVELLRLLLSPYFF
jgi:hypothetical protein